MASPCLYIDVTDTFVSGSTTPGTGEPVQISYADLLDTEDAPSAFDGAMELMAQKLDLTAVKRAVIFLPPDWVWFRFTPLPFKNKKKIGQILPFELSASYPDPERPVLTDFHPIKPVGQADFHLIFSGAVEETKVRYMFHALRSLGVSPAVITVKGLARALTFAQERDSIQRFVFICQSHTDITLILISQGAPLMVRGLKCRNQMSAQRLAGEIHTIQASDGLNPLDGHDNSGSLHIFFSGDTPLLDHNTLEPGFERNLETQLQKLMPGQVCHVESLVHDPLQPGVTCERQPPYLLNFCVGPYRTDSFLQRYKAHLAATVMLIFVVFGLGVYDLHRKNKALSDRINQIRSTAVAIYNQNFPGAGQVPAPLMFMESKVKQAKGAGNLKGASAVPTSFDIKAVELLYELSTRIPKNIDIEITRLTLNNDRLVITGLTANFNYVDRIKGLVKASSLFKDASIQSAEADKTGKQVRFKLLLEI